MVSENGGVDVAGPDVREAKVLDEGHCNTCTRVTHYVYVIQGRGRSLRFNICRDCMGQIGDAVRHIQRR